VFEWPTVKIVAVSVDLADAVGAQRNHVVHVLLNRATMGRSCIDDALTDGFTKLGVAMVIETGQDRSRLGGPVMRGGEDIEQRGVC